MDLDLELLALVKAIIGEYFDDEKGYSNEFIFFGRDDFEYFLVVEFEIIDGDFVGFFTNLFNKDGNLIFFHRHVNVDGKETHECNHEFFFQRIRKHLSLNDRQLQL